MKVISTRNRSRSARSAFTRLTACLTFCGSLTAPHARAETGAGALNRLSLGELGALEVTSVTKDPQPVSDAAATIYVITRPAVATQGEIASLGLGNREQRGGFRHGGRLGESAHYRVYGRGFVRGETESPDGAGRNDEWHNGQGGFRGEVALDTAEAVARIAARRWWPAS